MKEMLRIIHAMQDDLREDVLHDYNLEVYEGDILYIQGIAGSGIKTLVNVFAGDCNLKRGSLFLYEEEVKDYNRNTAYQYHIYSITAEKDMVDNMTVTENLEAIRYLPFPASIYHKRKAEKDIDDYLKKEQVYISADEHLWALTSKERKKLSILKAKIHKAKLIILDVTNDLYEGKEADEICQLIQRANKDGITFVILAEHYTVFAEIANRIQVISNGIDLMEWSKINDHIREKLRYQSASPDSLSRHLGKSKGSRCFFGLYDYEWEMHDGLWEYLNFVKNHNRKIWENEINADIPDKGCSHKNETVLIPRNSAEYLLKNLSIEDNLIISVPDRVSKGRGGIINKNICRYITRKFFEQTGIDPEKNTVEELNGIERKILSIYRWELAHPKVIFLESPYGGMNLEETCLLRNYLNKLSKKGIRIICFSKSLDDLKKDCKKIIITEKGLSAKIATF